MYLYILILYFNDVGINSYKAIWSIIPATIDNIIPIIMLFIILDKNRCASSAPRGSDRAEARVYRNAFPLLFVLWYIGTAILIPSGIL